MNRRPWDGWVPGVLSKSQLQELVTEGLLDGASKAFADQSSLDLTLGNEGYEITEGCIKPWGDPYLASLRNIDVIRPLRTQRGNEYLLKKRRTYVFRLRERLGHLAKSPIYGQATAKSSIGRMDVLARLIVDGMDEYEGFEPDRVSAGDLFVEITPMTFDVIVRPGIPITQLRLFKGRPEDCQIDGEHLYRTVLGEGASDATLSADLTPVDIAGHPAVAFCAQFQTNRGPELKLWKSLKRDLPKPWKHWKFCEANANSRLPIKKNRFYIIRSHEKISLPPGVAVYARASDETIGEMRIHYAGFVHPFFGHGRRDRERGTPLIFEVRGHDVDVSLRHGEKMARLEFYRMSKDCEPGKKEGTYDSQTLKLSSLFGRWPRRVTVDSDGTVHPRK